MRYNKHKVQDMGLVDLDSEEQVVKTQKISQKHAAVMQVWLAVSMLVHISVMYAEHCAAGILKTKQQHPCWDEIGFEPTGK